ncbi:hypothetical protein ACFXOM_16785 [Streptomyces sp. NPDC059169]|uniref:hypothetical protein n=1 Tax=Streptomyces sp. NPDC059169 TaxID=3346754 RepID=UPI0036BBFBEF
MTTPQPLPLKSPTGQPTGPAAAKPSPATFRGAALKGVAEGVLTAVRPDTHPATPPRADGRWPVAWLDISAPRGIVPTTMSRCARGWDRSAVGHRKVLALIADHTAHRDVCPLRTTPEGRAAA